MNLGKYIECEMKEKKLNKIMLYELLKVVYEGNGEKCVAYNTFTTKFNNSSFTAEEYLYICSILDVDITKTFSVIKKITDEKLNNSLVNIVECAIDLNNENDLKRVLFDK